MTDKELLELAAKAVGFSDYYVSEWVGGASLMHSPDPKIGPVEWNPLTDDGDALRLAVKLRMEVYIARYEIEIHAHIVTVFQPTDDDAAPATRRAIVRAAAEIGKAMP